MDHTQEAACPQTPEHVYIGIYFNQTAPAICILGNDFRSSTFYFMSQKRTKADGSKNLHWVCLTKNQENAFAEIRQWAVETIRKHFVEGNTTIVFEGYGFANAADRYFVDAEMVGRLKFILEVVFGQSSQTIAPADVRTSFAKNIYARQDDFSFALKKREDVDVVKWLGLKQVDGAKAQYPKNKWDGTERTGSLVQSVVASYAITWACRYFDRTPPEAIAKDHMEVMEKKQKWADAAKAKKDANRGWNAFVKAMA